MSNTHVMGQDRAAGFHRGFQVQEEGPRAGRLPPTKLFLAGPVMAGGQCQPHKGLSDQSLPKGQFLPSLGTGPRCPQSCELDPVAPSDPVQPRVRPVS